MEILPQNKYSEYEEFVKSHPKGTITQSARWAKVKKNWKHDIVVSRSSNGEIKGGMLILTKSIPILGYSLLYSPRGPVCNYDDHHTLADLMQGVKQIRKKRHGYLFKTDPYILSEDQNHITQFTEMGFNFTPNLKDFETVQSRHNYMLLDIDKMSKEELLKSFHSKWRYNIRLAARKGVVCKVCGKEALADFYLLYRETAQRDNFAPRALIYFANMMDALGDYCRLYMCYYNNMPVSGAICTQFAGKTCYIYGASTAQHRNVMPNYLMQWEMIQWALDNHCSVYDFQGIPVDLSGNSSTHGVYRFKHGFRGKEMLFAGEFDMVYKPVANRLFNLL